MPKLVFEKKENVEALLETVDVSAYFFVDYYEMPSGMFFQLDKTYPAGTLTVEQLKEELEKLYEENIPYYKKWDDKCYNQASICIFIGFFDEDREFRVVANKMYG